MNKKINSQTKEALSELLKLHSYIVAQQYKGTYFDAEVYDNFAENILEELYDSTPVNNELVKEIIYPTTWKDTILDKILPEKYKDLLSYTVISLRAKASPTNFNFSKKSVLVTVSETISLNSLEF